MSPAGLYVHYSAKADLLYEVSQIGHTSVLAAVHSALAEGGSAPDRTRRYVEAFTAWHAMDHDVARIIQYELRTLSPERFRSIAATRQQFQELMEEELRTGSSAGSSRSPRRAIRPVRFSPCASTWPAGTSRTNTAAERVGRPLWPAGSQNGQRRRRVIGGSRV